MEERYFNMKKFILLFVALTVKTVIAQSVSPNLIATSGTSFNDGTSQLDWTMGEPVTVTFAVGSDMLTQGFQQPNLLATSINNVETDYSVLVFPNPSIDFIQLQFHNLKQILTIDLFSSDGKLLQSKEVNTVSELQIDMSKYAAGTYLLSVKDSNSKIKTYQVIKLN